ncbi:CDP-diacylglycerol--glycerol-3-phosphate 3-phosphatidyltransferase [Fervidobacterium thailandense]|uniref:CDP-diacylglycerol--glycerol-3-phosphate 3-phosphatidyltransferase n=1 Tax=Fervidobacterium thailandense TaxID=1008305 RepID=A0A1E3G1H9_9BACT|nr:CDP-diacylglycerol--glycerol-3-phosphate 3-phosphatidyltransferase [Fervidobacterium thailandense]
MACDKKTSVHHSVVFNIPNTISWLRIVATALIVLFLYLKMNVLAFVLFLLASVSDCFDGYIARKTGQVTNLGKVLDQMSDKILITSVLVIFTEKGLTPGWLVVAMVFRDTLVSIVRIMASEGGKIVAANYLGKLKTVSQMVLVIGLFLQILGFSQLRFINSVLVYVTMFFTVLSGIVYIYQNREHLNR